MRIQFLNFLGPIFMKSQSILLMIKSFEVYYKCSLDVIMLSALLKISFYKITFTKSRQIKLTFNVQRLSKDIFKLRFSLCTRYSVSPKFRTWPYFALNYGNALLRLIEGTCGLAEQRMARDPRPATTTNVLWTWANHFTLLAPSTLALIKAPGLAIDGIL